MGNLSCGNLDPPPSSGGQSAASSPSALHEDGLTKRFRRWRSPFREPPKSHRHPVGMVIAIISESRSASVRNRDRHHLGTLIAIARNTHDDRCGRRWRSPGSGGANWLGFSAAAASGIPASRRHAGGYLLARLGGTTGGRSHTVRSEEHTSELQSLRHLVCRLLL